ncbi:MAG: PAS domain S-box protein [Pirellulales bacterium]|nr:PAS domain S-box protein [Pirellulales bacterium]
MPVADFFRTNGLPFPPLGAHHRALGGEASTYEQKWAGRTLQLHVGPRYDEQNHIVGCTGFGQDVTDRELAEQALRESESRYRTISELTSTYAYSALLAPGGNLFPEWVTGDFVQITGYTLDEIKQLGGPIKLIHPADREVAVKRTECLLAGQPHISEFRIITKSGATRWLRDYGRPIRDDLEERTLRIFGAAQDITDRKQAEQALRESEERFRLVFEEGPLGMATLTPDGTLLQVNRALAQMLAFSPEEMVGKSLAELVHPDDAAGSAAVLRQLAHGDLPRHTWEKRCLTADGRVVWGRVTATVLHDHEGNMLCVLMMIEDITERKRTEEALRRAERLASIGTLAAGIAHEINNPLGAITLSVDAVTLAEEQADREEILRVALENIRASALRCGRIVKSVLQFARDEVSQKSLGDLADVVRRARDMARSFAKNQEVTLDLEIEDDLPPMVMNSTEIGQVVVSLLSNAVHASEPESQVVVRVTTADGAVQILVEDQGCGMTPEQVARVFDPFYTSRPERGGIGLGLSISYGIVRQHGGTIDVRSKPAEGTTVCVTLPLEAPMSVEAALVGDAVPESMT